MITRNAFFGQNCLMSNASSPRSEQGSYNYPSNASAGKGLRQE